MRRMRNGGSMYFMKFFVWIISIIAAKKIIFAEKLMIYSDVCSLFLLCFLRVQQSYVNSVRKVSCCFFFISRYMLTGTFYWSKTHFCIVPQNLSLAPTKKILLMSD